MGKDLFKFLPSEIINNIHLRLPVGAIAASKCVCRSWLDLLQTDEFVKSHLARSSESCLAILMKEDQSSWCNVYELEEEIDAHDVRHHSHLTMFDFPQEVSVLGSANGLLLLLLDEFYTGALYVCNPISREYIDLNCPIGFFEKKCNVYLADNYGFGVSNVSGQYKVVRIIDFYNHCHVYTLGTSSWRRVDIPSSAYGYRNYRNSAAVVNGNLHWILVQVLDGTMSLISCFDLETECFSTFSHPPLVVGNSRRNDSVFALRDCLCWCDHTFLEDDGTIYIWLMKEYGVEKSWRKEYVINFSPDFDTAQLYRGTPIKVLKNGDVLIQWSDDLLFYYSNKMKTTQQFGGQTSSVLFTPSFLSLRSFRMENVFSL